MTGSILYDYRIADKLRFETEAGITRGIAGSAILEFDGIENRVRTRNQRTLWVAGTGWENPLLGLRTRRLGVRVPPRVPNNST